MSMGSRPTGGDIWAKTMADDMEAGEVGSDSGSRLMGGGIWVEMTTGDVTS